MVLTPSQSRQLLGGDLAVAVHQYDQRLPMLVFHDQGFDHAVFVHAQAARAVGGAAMFLVGIEVAAEGMLLSRNNRVAGVTGIFSLLINVV